MSLGRIQHKNRSRQALGLRGGESERRRRRRSNADSDDDHDTDIVGKKDLEDAFELRDLSTHHEKSIEDENELESFSGNLRSDDDEPAYFDKPRRGSASTTQSFMLYTPDEERAVIKKFDRRLVLFVAFLYMLSFLDRSSTYFDLQREDRCILTPRQILGTQGSRV